MRSAPLAPVALIAAAALLCAATTARAAPRSGPRAQSGAPPSATATATGSAGDDMAARLAGIEAALDRIALLLADSLDQQLVNVLMRRIELKERGLEPLQQALRDARGERDGLVEEQKRLRNVLELMGGLEPGPPPPGDEPRLVDLAQGRNELERITERIAVLDQRIAEMESDLFRQRDDIRDLEEMVDERIGLR